MSNPLGLHASAGVLRRPWIRFTPPKAEDAIVLLAKRNYKVHADIGFNTTMTVRRVATLDTGAGPNVIRLSELPTAAKAKIKHGPLPRVTDANRNPLRMMGTITLVVRLGRHLAKV